MDSRLELFDFQDVTNAFSDLAFNDTKTAGGSPRMTPLRTSLDHIERLGCNSIIKQFSVDDPDYSAEYLAYYSRLFGGVDKHCHRFHFFSIPLMPNEDILDFIDRAYTTEGCYLGFITIRPVRSSPVAASILRKNPNEHFLLSKDNFPVHLAGRKFIVHGTPFMQQDNAVGACAQASIWMALRTLRKKEGTSAFNPAQITSAATRFLVRGRTLPNREGLAVDQMIEAIRFAGYSPHIMEFSSDPVFALLGEHLKSAKRKIYTYVESELPVVIGVFPPAGAGHALVIVGHKWERQTAPKPTSVLANGLALYHAADWVSEFIVHNDNSGPYMNLPDSSMRGGYALNQVRFAIPLLPSDVFMTGDEAEAASIQLLSDVWAGVAPLGKREDVVFRTYLLDRRRFREWVTDNPHIHKDVKGYYRKKLLPKRIWITEINLKSRYDDVINGTLPRVGEILIDPTGELNDVPFLSIHLNISAMANTPNSNGFIIDRDSKGNDITTIPVVNDTIYSTLYRAD